VHEFSVNAHVRTHAITADFGSKLIRNQQVVRSIRIAGSIFHTVSNAFRR